LKTSKSSISKKEAGYFEWMCDNCKWGARGYDEKALIDLKKQHDELGCKEFISMIELRGKRINDGYED
jgi:hypothetical protein